MIAFFSEAEVMQGYQGDTFPEFRITVEGVDLTGCTMRVEVETYSNPKEIILTKNCTYFEEETGNGFSVQLQTEDTLKLNGIYSLNFIMSDGTNEFRKLVAPLVVVPCASEKSQ